MPHFFARGVLLLTSPHLYVRIISYLTDFTQKFQKNTNKQNRSFYENK